MMVVAVGFNAEVLNSPSSELLTAAGISARGGRLTRSMDCLVVSGDASRRHRFAAAAELAGWDECSSPEDLAELRDAADRDFSLAIIDITSPVGEVVSDTVELAEELTARPNTLVVICGSEDNVDEELWARQLGAWLYLPGVADGDSLMSLCVEARRLREVPAGFGIR
jgi:DNA-binding NtrC family response regulator